MDMADKILENAKSEDEYKKNIVDYAKVIHGDDVINRVMENSPDEDSFIQSTISLAKSAPKTEEDKLHLNDVVYPALRAGQDTLSALSLPARFAAGGIGYLANRASNAIQGKPQEPDIDPLEHPSDFADQYGTTGAVMRTLDTGNKPIMKNMDPDQRLYMQRQFPNLYKNISGVTQDDLHVAAMDSAIAMGGADKAPKVKPISLETAADYVRSLAKGQGQLEQLEASGKIYGLAEIVQRDPETYLKPFRPNKIYAHLMGDVQPELASRDYGNGAIKQAVGEQDKFLEGLPKGEYSVPMDEMQAAAIEKLNKNSGTMLPGQSSRAEQIIRENVPVDQPNQAKLDKIRAVQDAQQKLYDIGKSNPSGIDTPKEVVEKYQLKKFIKENMDPSMPGTEQYNDYIRGLNEKPVGMASHLRRLGNKLQEPLMPGELSTDVSSKNLAGQAIEAAGREAQDKIMSSDSVPQEHVDRYNKLNTDISNMISMRDLLQGNLTADETHSTVVPNKMQGPKKFIAKNFNRYIRPMADQAGRGTLNMAAGGSMSDNVTPTGISAPGRIFNKPLPMQLVNFQIPRNSDQILANKDIVIAKVAQMSNNPEIVDMIKDAVEEHPEKLSKVLPALILKFPDLFESDDYNRVDGKIFDPQMKQKALNDLQNNKTMSLKERAFKAKRLQQESILQ